MVWTKMMCSWKKPTAGTNMVDVGLMLVYVYGLHLCFRFDRKELCHVLYRNIVEAHCMRAPVIRAICLNFGTLCIFWLLCIYLTDQPIFCPLYRAANTSQNIHRVLSLQSICNFAEFFFELVTTYYASSLSVDTSLPYAK